MVKRNYPPNYFAKDTEGFRLENAHKQMITLEFRSEVKEELMEAASAIKQALRKKGLGRHAFLLKPRDKWEGKGYIRYINYIKGHHVMQQSCSEISLPLLDGISTKGTLTKVNQEHLTDGALTLSALDLLLDPKDS